MPGYSIERSIKAQPQGICLMAGIFLLMCCGLHSGWTHVSLFNMPLVSSEFSVSNVWFMGITYFIGVIPAAMVCPTMFHLMGNKKCLSIAVGLLIAAGITFVADSISFVAILIGRFLSGFAFGLIYIIIISYSGEIVESDLRGMSVVCVQLMIYVGAMQQYTELEDGINMSLANFIIGIITIVIAVISGCAIFTMRISPVQDLILGYDRDAKKTFMKLRNENVMTFEMNQEFNQIISMISEDYSSNKYAIIDIFTNSRNLRAFCFVLIIKFLYILSYNPLLSYIHLRTLSTIMEQQILIIIIPITIRILVISCITIFVVDRSGRRPLLIASGGGCAVMLLGEAIATMLDADGIAFAFILLFEIFAGIGIGCIPEVYMSESFALNIKYTALSIITIIEALFMIMFVSVAVLVNVDQESMVLYIVLFGSSALCVMGAAFVKLLVPETVGATLKEARDRFKKPEIIYTDNNMPP